MFDQERFIRATSDGRTGVALDTTDDVLEQGLIRAESMISRIRAHQLRLLRRADLAQAPIRDGSRSLEEWTAARLDVTHETARDLVTAARAVGDYLEETLAAGEVSFDRAVAVTRLVSAGASDTMVSASYGHDLVGVRRLTAAQRRFEPGDERDVFDSRHAAIQLSLDQTSANVWARLSGVDSEIVTKALDAWADKLPLLPDGTSDTRSHRQADAFVAIFRHALEGDSDDATSSGRGPHMLLTADLATLAESRGTQGAKVVAGPRVGVNALDEALCNGSVSLNVTREDGTVLGVGSRADVIPPSVRAQVLARDGGCSVAGCRSRYRLEVHHMRSRSRGGTHDPTNLTTLCWFHHHVVVHGMGYHIDLQSPPQRRRFLPPGSDPPDAVTPKPPLTPPTS